MSDKRTAQNLRLEDDEGESGTYIRLEDTGKDLADRWRLQAGETPSDWQPVEYDRPVRSGVGWILPLIIGAVVVGLIGLMLYAGIDRLRDSNILAGLPFIGSQENPTVVNEQPTDANPNGSDADGDNGIAEPSVTIQPTAISEPEPTQAIDEPDPVDVVEPEPTAVLIEEEIGIISNQYGVNARLQPSTTSEVLRVLEQDEEVVILDRLSDTENGIEWLQVLTSEEAEVWIAADFVEITTRLIALETGEVVDTIPGPISSGASAGSPNDFVLTDSDAIIPVTIDSQYGLNARNTPSADSEAVRILDDGLAVTAIQRSDDGEWIQVQLDNNERFWISSGFVALENAGDDLAALVSSSEVALRGAETSASQDPVVEEPAPNEPGSKEPVVEVADSVAPSDTPADDNSGNSIAFTIQSQYGANARSTTSVDAEVVRVVEENVELSAIGRTADSTWVQAALEDGTLVWLFTQTLALPDDISSLPVVAPLAVGQPAAKLPASSVAEPIVEVVEPEVIIADPDADEITSAITSTVSLTSTSSLTSTVSLTSTDAMTSTDISPDVTGAISTTETITGTTVSTTTIDSTVALTTTETMTDTDSAATATITSLIDAKARPRPNAGEESIQGIPNGVVLAAIGRTEDGFWVQVQLTDDTPAWVFANNVELSVDIDSLPIVTPEN